MPEKQWNGNAKPAPYSYVGTPSQNFNTEAHSQPVQLPKPKQEQK